MTIKRLLRRAKRVIGSKELALQWLKTPAFGLGGRIPLEVAETPEGAREVMDLLGRIEHSVYS